MKCSLCIWFPLSLFGYSPKPSMCRSSMEYLHQAVKECALSWCNITKYNHKELQNLYKWRKQNIYMGHSKNLLPGGVFFNVSSCNIYIVSSNSYWCIPVDRSHWELCCHIYFCLCVMYILEATSKRPAKFGIFGILELHISICVMNCLELLQEKILKSI